MRCTWCDGILDPAVEATIVERYNQAAVVAGSEPIEVADPSTTTLVHPPENRPPDCQEPAGTRWMVIGTVLPHLFRALTGDAAQRALRHLSPAGLAPPGPPGAPVRCLSEVDLRLAQLFAYERATDDETIIVVVHFGPAPKGFRVLTGGHWTMIFDTEAAPSTRKLASGDRLTLGPREAIILLAG